MVDRRVSVLPFGGDGSWAGCDTPNGRAGDVSQRRRPASLPECPFCEARAAEAEMREHVTAMHRERLRAALAYAKARAEGIPEPEARAAANAIVRASLEGGAGHYDRAVNASLARHDRRAQA